MPKKDRKMPKRLTKSMVIERIMDSINATTEDEAHWKQTISHLKKMPASEVISEAQGVFGWDITDPYWQNQSEKGTP